MLKDFITENSIKWVTSVPSLRRPGLVKNFAERLAERLNLPYYSAINKVNDNVCQKELNTSYLQFHNAYGAFEIESVYSGNVLLVDDMVDSKWTFTVCGYKLKKCGSGDVFPFALANSAGRNGED